jgi:hypothetical protein
MQYAYIQVNFSNKHFIKIGLEVLELLQADRQISMTKPVASFLELTNLTIRTLITERS